MKNCTKIIIAIAAVICFASAQGTIKAQAFENGSLVGNAGLGFGWYDYNYYGLDVSSTPFLSVSLEKGFKDIPSINSVISLGGIAGFKSGSWEGYGYDGSYSDFIIGARGAIHADLFKVEKLDTYAGVVLGLRFHNEDFPYSNYVDDDFTQLLTGIFVGTRYYFNEKFAVFGELGAGTGYLNLGVTYKFK